MPLMTPFTRRNVLPPQVEAQMATPQTVADRIQRMNDHMFKGMGLMGRQMMAIGNPWTSIPGQNMDPGMTGALLAADEQRQIEQRREAQDRLFGQSGVGLMGRAFPEFTGRAMAESLFAQPKTPKPTERDKLRDDLRAQGYNDEQVRDFMINRDRYQFSTDMFGNRVIFDRYSGQPAGGTQPETPQATPPLAEQPPPEGVPTLSGGFQQATGLKGALLNLGNTITDAIGAGMLAPETDKGGQALNTLKTRTMLQMTAAIPGRPSDLIRQRLEALAVEPNSIWNGEERSLERLMQTRGLIHEEVSRITGILSEPGGYRPDELSALRSNRSQIEDLGRVYDHIINNWRAGSAGLARPTSESEYNKLPSGMEFLAPDGSIRRKP